MLAMIFWNRLQTSPCTGSPADAGLISTTLFVATKKGAIKAPNRQ